MGCYRVTYNRALDLSSKSKKKDYNFLRNAVVTNANVPEAWLRDCPGSIRKYAVRDLVAAYNSNFAKWRKDKNHRFRLRYKKKKDATQSIKVEHNGVKISTGSKLVMFPTKLAPISLSARNMPPGGIKYDFSLSMDQLGRFYIHIPYHKGGADNQGPAQRGSVCAVDPGVRTFLTTWGPEGKSFKIGEGSIQRLVRMCLFLDKLQSKIAITKKLRKTRRQKRAAARIRCRIKNLVAELHWKAASFLCCCYGTILLPEFQTQQMVRRASRKIRSQTARNMLTLSHYSFRQRLLHKAKFTGTSVTIVGEEYTSKTCTNCGWIHPSLGGSKVFKCGRCCLHGDRDGLAARNIFLKNCDFDNVTEQFSC